MRGGHENEPRFSKHFSCWQLALAIMIFLLDLGQVFKSYWQLASGPGLAHNNYAELVQIFILEITILVDTLSK